VSLQIFNTRTKQKERFEPLVPGQVKIYVCGPTVYDLLHVGNFRGPIFFNLVSKWLIKSGYKVNHVTNYTDVDDKIINRANQEKITSEEVAEKYIREYKTDYDTLGLSPHVHHPRVTEHMDDIIKMTQKIIENGKAYVAPDGEVIYSIKSFPEYGKLSGKNLDDLQSGIRVEISDKKKDPLDFTLWKPAKPGEPFWESPWGKGRPGWHIECSAMSKAVLGESIDIHGGGIDLIFPHHENEIAQSEAASNKPFVKYWMHWNFINFGAHKMSKSLGNVKNARSFMEQYHPEIMKYMMLRAQYRSHIDFGEDQILDAIQGLARMYSSLSLAKTVLGDEQPVVEIKNFDELIKKSNEEIANSLNDDFNTPKMFAQIFEVIRFFNSQMKRGQKITPQVYSLAKKFTNWIKEQGELMSLLQLEPDEFLKELDDLLLTRKGLKREEVEALVQKRISARVNKDFKTSDEMRDQLAKIGIAVSDTPQGTFWEVQK
jgi:cysteinyl-tRNA synthetase